MMCDCEGWQEWEDDDEMHEVDFEVGAEGEMDVPLAQAGFVLIGKLDPKTRMYIRIFREGPPGDPMLN